MSGDLSDHLKKICSDLKILREDMKKIVVNSDKDKSLKSLQPRIKMYKTKEEASVDNKNKDLDFIKIQIDKIFWG